MKRSVAAIALFLSANLLAQHDDPFTPEIDEGAIGRD